MFNFPVIHQSNILLEISHEDTAYWVLSYPLSTQQRLLSDRVDAQADHSLHWAHIPFCWFCHEADHICV